MSAGNARLNTIGHPIRRAPPGASADQNRAARRLSCRRPGESSRRRRCCRPARGWAETAMGGPAPPPPAELPGRAFPVRFELASRPARARPSHPCDKSSGRNIRHLSSAREDQRGCAETPTGSAFLRATAHGHHPRLQPLRGRHRLGRPSVMNAETTCLDPAFQHRTSREKPRRSIRCLLKQTRANGCFAGERLESAG